MRDRPKQECPCGLCSRVREAEAALAAAEGERDRALEDRHELQECVLRQKGTIDWFQGKLAAAEQRATRLETLEGAARTWKAACDHYDCEMADEVAAVYDAVAALAIPPAAEVDLYPCQWCGGPTTPYGAWGHTCTPVP